MEIPRIESIVLLAPHQIFVLYAVDIQTLAELVSAYMRCYGMKSMDVAYKGHTFRVYL